MKTNLIIEKYINEENNIKIIKNSNNEYIIVKNNKIYSVSDKKFIDKKNFIHSSDWKGISFKNKSDAKKALRSLL